MGLKRQVVRYAWRAAARRSGDALAADPDKLRREFTVDHDWRRTEGGYAPRLDPRTTISMDPGARILPLDDGGSEVLP
jgi:hypothetical protein